MSLHPDTSTPTDVLRLNGGVQRARAHEIGALLTAAFQNDPGTREVAVGDRPGYENRLRNWFDAILALHASAQQPVFAVEADGRLAGVAVAQAPNAGYPALGQLVSGTRIALRAGPRVCWRTVRNMIVSERHHPREPQYYLLFLGVHPDFHGFGFGGALLRALHATSEADPVSTAVCLETGTERNIRLYEYFGYQVTARYVIGSDAYTMVRPNGAEGPA